MKKEFTFSYNHLNSIEELNNDQRKAIEAADKAGEKAYAPYSNFQVGAALLLNDDTLVLGSDHEKKAYSSGLCAERVAIFSYEAPQSTQGIISLAITGKAKMRQSNAFFAPCGGCR